MLDFDILIVPGWLGSGLDHWQSRWSRSIAGAKLIDEPNGTVPNVNEWVGNIVNEVGAASRPVAFVAHSVGVISVVHAARRLMPNVVAGAFLVSPADVETAKVWRSH